MISQTTLSSPLWELTLIADETHLRELRFGRLPWESRENSILIEAKKELEEYFDGKRKYFDIPLAPHGTEFQEKAWKALTMIPYGETRSYGEEAQLAGSPKAVRAIGWANNKNPIAIIIPCHRVIGSDGSLTGYAGGVDKKKYLLDMEKRYL